MSEERFDNIEISEKTVAFYDNGEFTVLDENGLGKLLNRLHRENIYLSRIRENQQQMILKLKEENDELKQQLKTKVIVNKQYEELQRLKEENEKLLHQNEKYEMEIRALNSKIKDWYNDSAIAKLYEKEQDKTEILEKAYEECNAKWEKLFAENKKLKHQLAQIPPKIKEVWIE